MRLAEEAFDASRQGKNDRAHRLFLKALERERGAAEAFEQKLGAEPTRSVLYRSAATLAFHAGNLDESVGMITAGLEGNPPQEIREELHELLEQVMATRDSTTGRHAVFVSDSADVQSSDEDERPRAWTFDLDTSASMLFQQDVLKIGPAVIKAVERALNEILVDPLANQRDLVRDQVVYIKRLQPQMAGEERGPGLLVAYTVNKRTKLVRKLALCRVADIAPHGSDTLDREIYEAVVGARL